MAAQISVLAERADMDLARAAASSLGCLALDFRPTTIHA